MVRVDFSKIEDTWLPIPTGTLLLPGRDVTRWIDEGRRRDEYDRRNGYRDGLGDRKHSGPEACIVGRITEQAAARWTGIPARATIGPMRDGDLIDGTEVRYNWPTRCPILYIKPDERIDARFLLLTSRLTYPKDGSDWIIYFVGWAIGRESLIHPLRSEGDGTGWRGKPRHAMPWGALRDLESFIKGAA